MHSMKPGLIAEGEGHVGQRDGIGGVQADGILEVGVGRWPRPRDRRNEGCCPSWRRRVTSFGLRAMTAATRRRLPG